MKKGVIRFVTATNYNGEKNKVYLSCHPDDLSDAFQDVLEDMENACECTIIYADNMEVYPSDESEYFSALRLFKVFVFPITYSFMKNSCRAKDVDFKFAIENNIPVLPIFMVNDEKMYKIFSETVGDYQLLDRTANDPTQDNYESKLKKYLTSVLAEESLEEEIRKAFDAYVFLSYRKKDRKSAQDVMNIMKSNSFMRDIAIWYDENLTVGNDYNAEINAVIQKSKLVTLIVTPNLLESGNYVKTIEYPTAIKEEKSVLPIQTSATDVDRLKKEYAQLPEIVDKENEELIADAIMKVLFTQGIELNDDPQHLYFVALAYLHGIDVMQDTNKAIELLVRSADAGYDLAINQLVSIYENGIGVLVDYTKALEWQKKIYDKYQSSIDEHIEVAYKFALLKEKTVSSKEDLQDVLALYEFCYECSKNQFGKNNHETLRIYNSMANTILELAIKSKEEGKLRRQFISMKKDCYERHIKEYGNTHEYSIAALENLQSAYFSDRKNRLSLESAKDLYELLKDDTRANAHRMIKLISRFETDMDYEQDINHLLVNMYWKLYSDIRRTFGPEHRHSKKTLGKMANVLAIAGNDVVAESISDGKKNTVLELICDLLEVATSKEKETGFVSVKESIISWIRDVISELNGNIPKTEELVDVLEELIANIENENDINMTVGYITETIELTTDYLDDSNKQLEYLEYFYLFGLLFNNSSAQSLAWAYYHCGHDNTFRELLYLDFLETKKAYGIESAQTRMAYEDLANAFAQTSWPIDWSNFQSQWLDDYVDNGFLLGVRQ